MGDDFDVVVCKRLFQVLEKEWTSFEDSRLLWTRFVKFDKGGSALLIARCEKTEGLRAQLCLIPLGDEARAEQKKEKKEKKRSMWTSVLGAVQLADHFKGLGVEIDSQQVAEEMTTTFAHTLRTKDTVTCTLQGESIELSMTHILDEGTTIQGTLTFQLSCTHVDDLLVNLMLDMAFSLLDQKMRALKHKEHMLSKETGRGTGWLQTLEQDDAPLVNAALAARKRRSTSSVTASQDSPNRPVKRRHAPLKRGPRKRPGFVDKE